MTQSTPENENTEQNQPVVDDEPNLATSQDAVSADEKNLAVMQTESQDIKKDEKNLEPDELNSSSPRSSEDGRSQISDSDNSSSNVGPTRGASFLITIKGKLVEESPKIELISRQKIRKSSRRSFLIYSAGIAGSAAGLWWLLPDEVKEKLGVMGKSDPVKDDFLNSALKFDDDVAAALFSKDRLVPTYTRADMTEVPNNFAGDTPNPEFINGWKLKISGLADKSTVLLTSTDLQSQFQFYDQITRLVCVEGWSAISSWGGLRFADLIRRYPPSQGSKWCQLRSEVNLDSEGNSDPYFVSFDILSAIHPQTLLATHHDGKALELEHGAPLRLLAPMKLGLKNIKAITSISYHQDEPADYWNKNGYSYYDGI